MTPKEERAAFDETGRKLVYGAGLNDAIYSVQPLINGEIAVCPFYQKWRSMLARCYLEARKKNFPTYKGCRVCDRWLIFSNFKKWMETQDWKDKELDKDILIEGNKLYSPETCVFVTGNVNALLNNHASGRGKWPQGVTFYKKNKKFGARVNISGKSKFLGLFSDVNKASLSYKRAKTNEIMRIASSQDNKVKLALAFRAIKFLGG